MLLQSCNGAIDILPALPKQWRNGFVKGLRAQGGFTVDITWKNNELETFTIHSNLGGNCRIRTFSQVVPDGNFMLNPAEGENPNMFTKFQN